MRLFKSILFAIFGLSALIIECIILYNMPMYGNFYQFALYCASLFLIPISVGFLCFAWIIYEEYKMFHDIRQFEKQLGVNK